MVIEILSYPALPLKRSRPLLGCIVEEGPHGRMGAAHDRNNSVRLSALHRHGC